MEKQTRVLLALAVVLGLAAVGSSSAASLPAGAAVSASMSVPPSTQGTDDFDSLPPGLASTIARTLADDLPASYRLRASGSGYRADNVAHSLATTFGSAGPQMTIAGETWGLTLAGLGRGRVIEALPAAEVAANGTRMEYHYPGLIEWYLNTFWGLEQGFSLETPPAGHGDLVLELVMSGNLRANLQDDTTLQLTNALGQAVARYAGLLAFDASGRLLPARLQLDQTLVSIIVDDKDAVYPITIDPWVQQASLVAGDGAADDLFGYTVDVSGDLVVVGAHQDDDNGEASGSAYIYRRPPGGWTSNYSQTAKLLPSDGAAGDHFGRSVAVSGDTVVVGAYLEDPNDVTNAGAAYVFVVPDFCPSTLNEVAKLVTDDGVAGDHFGNAVAISGDTVVVGVPINDEVADNAGKAYVFVKPEGSWSGTLSQTAKLMPSDALAGDQFGQSVSISGNVVAVGAYLVDANGDDSGAAYVFEKGGGWDDGSANEKAKLLPSDGEAGDRFGRSVAIDGDTVVVGAYRDNTSNGDDSGSAYVFVKPPGGWAGWLTQDAKLLPNDGVADDEFGNPVSISGDRIAVGALGDPAGTAYVFEKGNGWIDGSANQTGKLVPSPQYAGDDFGIVSIDETLVVVGAFGRNSGTGMAYIFGLTPELQSVSPQPNSVGVPLDTTVTATYDQDMMAGSVTELTFAVHGMQSGLVTGAHGVIDGDTLIVTPNRSFHQGELVYAIATTSTANINGLGPTAPTQWQFNAGVVNYACVTGFGEVYARALTSVNYSSAVWGDYDGDGDLDILSSGSSAGGRIAQIYQNTGSGFSQVYPGSLTGVQYSSAAWGDYDNDGDLDILLTGQDSVNAIIASVYRNSGFGFDEVYPGALEGVLYGSADWGDYDNDGDLDILLTGTGSGGRVAKVYRNTGSGFAEVYPGALEAVYYSSAAWGDYDNDGDLDILLTGQASSGRIAKVYENTGSGFSEDGAIFLTGVQYGSVAWGDYDNDGDLDILLTGMSSTPVARVYLNTGSDFYEIYAGSLEPVRDSSVAWGDYDNDGDLDILLTGVNGSDVTIAKIYQNTGSGFSEAFAGSLTGVYRGSAAWGDYDNDGDLDILATGTDSGGNRIAKLYRNENCARVYLPMVMREE